MNQMVNNNKDKDKDKDKNINSSNSLVFGRWPQTKSPAPGRIRTQFSDWQVRALTAVLQLLKVGKTFNCIMGPAVVQSQNLISPAVAAAGYKLVSCIEASAIELNQIELNAHL